MSDFLKLNTGDLARGLVVAVAAVILGSLQTALTDKGLDFASYEWGAIFNLAVTAGLAYLSKNLLTDSHGKVMGKIG